MVIFARLARLCHGTEDSARTTSEVVLAKARQAGVYVGTAALGCPTGRSPVRNAPAHRTRDLIGDPATKHKSRRLTPAAGSKTMIEDALKPRRPRIRMSTAQSDAHAPLCIDPGGRRPVDFVGADHAPSAAGQSVGNAAILKGVVTQDE